MSSNLFIGSENSLSRSPSLRDTSIDILRGSAVLAMITAHTIFWTIAGKGGTPSVFLDQVMGIGNIVSFTTFLFCFGFGLHKSVLKRAVDKRSIGRISGRVGQLILLYLGLVYFETCFISEVPFTFGLAKNVLLLQQYAPFTEYLVPFFLFYLLFGLVHYTFPDLFRKILDEKRVVWTLTTSVIASILAVYLSQFSAYFEALMPVVIGRAGFFSFPLVPYLPVLMAGIALSSFSERHDYNAVSKVITQAALLVACLTLVLPYVFSLFHGIVKTDIATTLQRWPPSFLFLTKSLTFSLVWLAVIRDFKIPEFFCRVIFFVGNHSLVFVGFHLVILFSFSKYANTPLGDISAIFAVAGIVLSYWASNRMYYFIKRQL